MEKNSSYFLSLSKAYYINKYMEAVYTDNGIFNKDGENILRVHKDQRLCKKGKSSDKNTVCLIGLPSP